MSPSQDPVVAADGHTYERQKILEWIEVCVFTTVGPNTEVCVFTTVGPNTEVLQGRFTKTHE